MAHACKTNRLASLQLHLRSGDVNNSQAQPRRSIGRGFADVAHSLLDLGRAPRSLLAVQGIALLWIYEQNAGDKTKAAQLSALLSECDLSARLDVPTTGTRPGEPFASDWRANSAVA